MYEKKTYTAPVLAVHGNVEDITLNCNYTNADSPSGNDNAYPGGGKPCS
jgi:hypothetical protein